MSKEVASSIASRLEGLKEEFDVVVAQIQGWEAQKQQIDAAINENKQKLMNLRGGADQLFALYKELTGDTYVLTSERPEPDISEGEAKVELGEEAPKADAESASK